MRHPVRSLIMFALVASALAAVFMYAAPAHAQGGGFNISQGIVGNLTSAQCRERGDCGWCDLVDLMVVLQKVILYLFGGLALVMIIWGGFGIVMAAGNAEKIASNKKLIVSTLLGILIILAAYFVISVTVTILTQPVGGRPQYAPLTQEWWRSELNCYTPQDGDQYCATAPDGSLCYHQLSGNPFVCKQGKCGGNACKDTTLGLGSAADCYSITACGSYITGSSIDAQRQNCADNPSKCKLNLCAPLNDPTVVCCLP